MPTSASALLSPPSSIPSTAPPGYGERATSSSPELTPSAPAPLFIVLLKADRLYADALRGPTQAAWPHATVRRCHSAAEFRAIATQTPVDILISGLTYPDTDSLLFLREVLAQKYARHVLVATGRREGAVLEALQVLPVSGIFDSHSEDVPALVRALHVILAGRRYESPTLRAHLATLHADLRIEAILSPLERLVLSAIGDGTDDEEAAGMLRMTRHAVRKHRERIHRKLGITTRAKLIAFAHEHGFVRFEASRVSRPVFESLMAECRKRKSRRCQEPIASTTPPSALAT